MGRSYCGCTASRGSSLRLVQEDRPKDVRVPVATRERVLQGIDHLGVLPLRQHLPTLPSFSLRAPLEPADQSPARARKSRPARRTTPLSWPRRRPDRSRTKVTDHPLAGGPGTSRTSPVTPGMRNPGSEKPVTVPLTFLPQPGWSNGDADWSRPQPACSACRQENLASGHDTDMSEDEDAEPPGHEREGRQCRERGERSVDVQQIVASDEECSTELLDRRAELDPADSGERLESFGGGPAPEGLADALDRMREGTYVSGEVGASRPSSCGSPARCSSSRTQW